MVDFRGVHQIPTATLHILPPVCSAETAGFTCMKVYIVSTLAMNNADAKYISPCISQHASGAPVVNTHQKEHTRLGKTYCTHRLVLRMRAGKLATGHQDGIAQNGERLVYMEAGDNQWRNDPDDRGADSRGQQAPTQCFMLDVQRVDR